MAEQSLVQLPGIGRMKKLCIGIFIFFVGIVALVAIFPAIGSVIAFLFIALIFVAARSDPVPGNVSCPSGYNSPLYFCSEDMSTIEIARPQSRPEHAPPVVQIAMPRAYINFVPRYEPQQYPRLPDRIEADSFHILLSYPDGTPLTIFEPRLTRQRRMQETRDAAQPPQGRYGEEVRWHTLVAKIYLLNGPAQVFGERIRASRTRSLERAHPYEGREYFSGHRQHVYLGQRGVDEFDFISCWENSHPLHYCEAQVQVSDQLVAFVSFVDFRFHGGFDFANERLRVARRTICNFAVPSCSIDGAMN